MVDTMNYKITVGDITNHDIEEWDSLIENFGNGFQKSSLIKVFQEHWMGVFEPKHISISHDNKLVAAVPAYLYESCPRLDYYKSQVSDKFRERILLSQDLLGWYGQPAAENQTLSKLAVEQFCKVAAVNQAVAMFSGIDGREKSLLKTLKDLGFHLSLFHTLMVRDVGTNISDPTCDLPKRKRNRVRNHINNALKAGVTYREMKKEELNSISEMIVRIIREDKVSEDVLPEVVVKEILMDENSRVLVALNENKIPIGVKVFLINGRKIFGWLSGHYRESLKKYRQSHFLYEEGIKLAAEEGLTEIQAGRSPYEVKLTHGYQPTPIFCAIKGTQGVNQHNKCISWVDSLAERHKSMFEETFEQEYWERTIEVMNEVEK
jgi:hypothetical protein